MTESLFSRLERFSFHRKSSTENLFTELLAYLLETDWRFRRRFLEHIFPDSPRLVRRYFSGDLRTQHTLSGDSRMDLVFITPRGNLYFENKIQSQEGWTSRRGQPGIGQIARHLTLLRDNDHLVYLTGNGAPAPVFRRSARNQRVFAGHLYWDEIYGILKRGRPRASDRLQALVLDYMEDNAMTAIEGFTKTNLREARSAFAYIKKSERLLDMLWDDIGPTLETWLGKNYGRGSVQHDSYDSENLYCRYSDRRNRLNIYLSIIIGSDGRVYLGFGPGTWKKQSIAAFESDEKVRIKCKRLVGAGWEKVTAAGWWEVAKYFKIKPKPLEDLRDELLPKVRAAMSELKTSQLAHILQRRAEWAE